MNVTQRKPLLDVFKLIAAICIVGIHCKFLLNTNNYIFQIFTNGLFMAGVPLFICINGFFIKYFFEKNSFKKWTKRILILYLVWSFLYCYFWITPFNITKTIKILLFGFNHLWYLIAVFFAALTLFLLRNVKAKILLLLATSCYLIGLTIQYLGLLNVFEVDALAFKIVNYPPVYRNFIFYAFPFLTFGFLINTTNTQNKISKSKSLLLLIISFIVIVIEALVNKYLFSHNVVVNMHISYLIIVPSLLIYSLKSDLKLSINSKFLANMSIAIYLIHPWIIYFFISIYNLENSILTFWSILGTLVLSVFLIKLNTYLKFLL